MNPNDPNVQLVELATTALCELRDEIVLVGGCAVGLLITDYARPPVRATRDVDLVVEITTAIEYHAFSKRLRQKGFQEDVGEIICRWRHDNLIVDVMPSNEGKLGFTNQWYPHVIRDSTSKRLPNGNEIRVINAPLFIATKIEAFYGRGNDNFQESHDIEDIVNLVDGRIELQDEIAAINKDLREYLMSEIEGFLTNIQFTDALPRYFSPDAANQSRIEIVIDRLRKISGL